MKQCLEEDFKRKKIYIFGAGNRGRKCAEILAEYNIEPKGFFDNSFEKCNSFIGKIVIQKPVKIENAIVIITVDGHYEEIFAQLINLGYSIESILSLEIIMRYIDEKKKILCKFPSTIQLPITYRCNFDCVMCGMSHMTGRRDFSADDLKIILNDMLFTEIESVGINGGEPFLKKDLVECVDVIISILPKLKTFYIITNGYFTEIIIEKLKEIKNKCRSKGIKVFVSISVDGVREMQDFHRGKQGAYEKAVQTIEMIQQRHDEYVDYLDVICTITKYNVFNLNEMVQFGKTWNIDIAYNLATENIRIENAEKTKCFSIFSDEQARMVAMEFFYSEYKRTGKEKYFGLFLYLRDKKRYTICPCMYNEWITLTPDSEISFCATQSKELGSALEKSAQMIVEENIDHLNWIKLNKCATCSHYGYYLNTAGYSELFWDNMRCNYKQWREWK